MIEPLPSTGISKVLNLCEILDDHGGSENLYRLGMDLYMPIGELLLVVKSAQMLGLAETPGNDVVLAPVGKTLLKSPAQEQKTLLKTQMLALAVFQHIVKLLKKKKGEAPVNLILEELAMQLPQEQPRQLFTTLLNWGRYAEIFSFSREADLFQLHKPG